MLETLLAFFFPFTLAVLAPGPNYAVMLNAARVTGRSGCLLIALGIGLGELIWATLSLFGVATLVERISWLETVLALGGGLFLACLGMMAIKAGLLGPNEPSVEPEAKTTQPNKQGYWFLQGLTLMMLNPKAAAFWLSLTSILLTADLSAAWRGLVIVIAVAISLAWHGSLAWFVSSQNVRATLVRIGPTLDLMLGAVLLGLAVYLIYSVL